MSVYTVLYLFDYRKEVHSDVVDVHKSLAGAWNTTIEASKSYDKEFWTDYEARDDREYTWTPYPEIGNFVEGTYGLSSKSKWQGDVVINGLFIDKNGTITRQIVEGEIYHTWTIELKPVKD